MKTIGLSNKVLKSTAGLLVLGVAAVVAGVLLADSDIKLLGVGILGAALVSGGIGVTAAPSPTEVTDFVPGGVNEAQLDQLEGKV